MPSEIICLVGAGGHAVVVIDALRLRERRFEIRLMDGDQTVVNARRLDLLIEPLAPDIAAGHAYHVAIGRNADRERVAALFALSRFHTICHPLASVAAAAGLGDGSFVAAGAIVAPLAIIGKGAIINHNAVVDHECIVGDFSHVAPGATIGGRARIGRRVLIGAGANILPDRTIGDDAVIAAGAVVIDNVPEGITFGGVPARPLRAAEVSNGG